LSAIQHDLFDVGAELATPADARWEGMFRVGDADILRLEAWIDGFNETLPPLREFVLPGGSRTSALLHQARTVCRRAERRTVSFGASGDPGSCVRYLNRLSDLLFVLSRWVCIAREDPEVLWDRDPPHRRSQHSSRADDDDRSQDQ
jgi:cob(I)alamin adenosyltransferase